MVHVDMDVASKSEESTFTCMGQEVQFKVLVTQFSLLNFHFLSSGENPAVIPSSQVQRLVDEAPSRSEQRFADQRACFEGP